MALRSPGPDVLAQLARARADAALASVLEASGGMMAVLNERRQVVLANKALLGLAGAKGVEEMCGLRPGEAVGCLNAQGEAACGEQEECSLCGAAQAFEETLRTGAASQREVRWTVATAAGTEALDLLARTQPFALDGERFVLLSLTDISAAKRRTALERIFFHDVLNTVSSFTVYLDLLKASSIGEQPRRLVDRLEAIAGALTEEIRGQKVLVSAENRTLSVQRELIESHDLAERLVQKFQGLQDARGRQIAVAAFSESFTFVSDDSLVLRVLGNMLKNALEATAEGGTVTVGFRPADAGMVRFEVHNPGLIPPDVAAQVFQRSFSTKGAGRGLGTWSMKLLAEEYLGGSVSFTSAGDRGTTFSLLLPRMPPKPRAG